MGLGAIIAGVSAVGGIASSVIGASAAGDAANAQVQAAHEAAQTQLHMYDTTRNDLMPWMNTGASANSVLASLYGLTTGPPGGAAGAGSNPFGAYGSNYGGMFGNIPGWHPPAGAAGAAGSAGAATGIPNTAAMTTALENTPGYQFTLGQGLQALDRSAASRGKLLSGGQLKDAQAYGQGLAQANAWNPYISELNSISTGGQNSAAKVGEIGQSYAGNIGSLQIGAGNAAATGINAQAQGIGSAIGQGTNLLQSLYGSSYGGSGAAAAAYGASPGGIAAPYNQFDFSGGGGTDYSGLFAYGS